MAFLIDTKVVSEIGRPSPDGGVLAWYEAQPNAAMFISVITASELYRGVARLPYSQRRVRLKADYQTVLRRFAGRLLAVDLPVAEAWAEIRNRHRIAGGQQAVADELIAATAVAYDLIVVTRNLPDFEHSGCRLLSPWSD